MKNLNPLNWEAQAIQVSLSLKREKYPPEPSFKNDNKIKTF